MKIKNIECGFVTGREDSSHLPGAVASDQSIFFMDSYFSEAGAENVFNYEPISHYVSDKIRIDSENDIFIGEFGAVADAYDFSSFDTEEKKRATTSIIKEQKCLFPSYEFVILEGEFPLEVKGTSYYETKRGTEVLEESKGIMSTHILYIKNYELMLQKNKQTLSKKR